MVPVLCSYIVYNKNKFIYAHVHDIAKSMINTSIYTSTYSSFYIVYNECDYYSIELIYILV